MRPSSSCVHLLLLELTHLGAAAAAASGTKKVKCLVTGGAGFLGKHLVNRLVESGRYEAGLRASFFGIAQPGVSKTPQALWLPPNFVLPSCDCLPPIVLRVMNGWMDG